MGAGLPGVGARVVDSLHRRIARLALDAAGTDGFVLAGGYALSAQGVGDRPSEDVDLFTNTFDATAFRSAAHRIIDALTRDGLEVRVERLFD